MNKDTIYKFLEVFGLESEEQDVFFSLFKNGVLSVSEIGKMIQINRSKVYRILESLSHFGLIEEVAGGSGKTRFKVVDFHKLDFLVQKKMAEVNSLEMLLAELKDDFKENVGIERGGTKTLFYSGSHGLEQMYWNSLKAKGEYLTYTHKPRIEIGSEEFHLNWDREFNSRGIIGKYLHSDAFLDSVKPHLAEAQPNIKALFQSKNYQYRYISPKILPITHQQDIYNDVVAFYNWHEGEVYGIEVYNQDIADFQKQIFYNYWNNVAEESPLYDLLG